MTVERGRDWGRPAPLPPDGVVVRSDAEARQVITDARRAGVPIPPLGLLGGDLCRTLGGTGDEARLHGGAATTFPVDLGEVLVDGRLHWFCAHLVARQRWWRGRAVVAMNAQYLGRFDLGPRSHPGDGLLDITDGALPLAERLEARRRARTGTHLPHPALQERRVKAAQFEFDRPCQVWLDGQPVGEARTISLRVEPDALLVVV